MNCDFLYYYISTQKCSTGSDSGFVPLEGSSITLDEVYNLTGDPSVELTPGTDDEAGFTEANYLHRMVSTIDSETSIVPTGFVQVDNQNSLSEKVAPSRLSEVDALRIDSYRVFCEPKMWREQVASGKSADDILDVLGSAKKGERVRGCWRAVRSVDGSSVLVRNLFWPGFSALYNATTNKFGTLYIGNGKKNMDVPFML